jgi:competence ComEA-like helix-hairpin-helix protein
MAKVSLRIYIREIESLIEQGQVDEAIAHCLHILKTFPKYLGAYRLLGKGYLEARRYSDATDIFQRVLMAVPDDFVSHVGMSIIRDDDGSLDDSIWHMERAFEAQPSNSAVQGELQRLYGRRDGVEPPKIRMTRGALAHMYVAGELYPQAISEIRSVLAEDPERTDMQILLGLAYFHSGQKVEASEIATQLLKKFPFCLDACRILTEVLPGTGRAEDTKAYRNRVNSLDPYAAFAKGSIFYTDQVPDSAVSVDRLEYATGQDVGMQPGWASSMGIQLSDESDQSQPDWLKLSEGESESGTSAEPNAFAELEDSPEAESAPEEGDNGSIPGWMREAGWGDSTGEGSEGPLDLSDEETPAEELAQGELPDWIKSMAPSEAEISAEETPAEANPAGDETSTVFDETPNWLDDLTNTPAGAPEVDEGEAPAWPQPANEESPEAEPETATAAETLDRLNMEKEPQPESQEEPEPAAEIIPEPEIQNESAAEIVEEVPPELQESTGDEKGDPDWLRELASDETAEPQFESEAEPIATESQIGDLGTSLDDQDAAMNWLESLASKHGAKAEELVTNPDERTDEAPEWVEQAKAISGETDNPEAIPAAEVPQQAPSPEEFVGAGFEPPASQESEEPEKPQEPDEPQAVGPVQDARTLRFDEQPTATDDWLKDWQGDLEQENEVPEGPTASANATAIWLKNLEADEQNGTIQDDGIAPANKPDEEPAQETTPGWLVQTEMTESLSQNEDLPDFLKDLVESPEAGLSDQVPETEASADILVEPVDLNRATLEELARLPGIGEMLAESIYAYRMTYGPFRNVDDLQDVAGIGPETIDELQQLVFVGDLSASSAESEPEKEVPDWLSDLEKDQKRQAEALDSDEDLPDWLQEEVDGEPPAQPIAHTEWQPANLADEQAGVPETNEAGKDFSFAPEITPEPVVPVTEEKLPAAPVQAKNSVSKDADLASAQVELEHGDIPSALKVYSKLIKKGRLLDEVIEDLRQALYQYPVEATIWQALGDAYMRANRLQDALDSYTKAEEFMR